MKSLSGLFFLLAILIGGCSPKSQNDSINTDHLSDFLAKELEKARSAPLFGDIRDAVFFMQETIVPLSMEEVAIYEKHGISKGELFDRATWGSWSSDKVKSFEAAHTEINTVFMARAAANKGLDSEGDFQPLILDVKFGSTPNTTGSRDP